MHCAEPGCLKACPSPGAIVQYANGIVDFNSEHCIGCGCAWPGAQHPRISKKDNKAYKLRSAPTASITVWSRPA